MINFLGVVIFATIIILGALDGKNGPSLVSTYRSARKRRRIGRRTQATEGRGDGT